MTVRKLLYRVLVLVMLVSMLLTTSAPILAQEADSPAGLAVGQIWKEKKPKKPKISHKDRKEAAQRAKDQGFVLETMAMGTADMALPGQAPRYFSHPNYANSPLPAVDSVSGAISGGIRKFVDPLPWAPQDTNPSSAPMPVAQKAVLSDDSEYYEIGLVQYRQQMHSDLPPTLLRGYVQLTDCANPGAVPLSNENLEPGLPATPTGFCGVTAPSYLGPAIVAQKNTPVRILFRNLLPAGAGGDLFIPTDTTVMGSGMGPDLNGMPETDPQDPTCEQDPKPAGCFTENRADLHLHGGLTPWISDGTPHQWITPAGETLPYPDDELLLAGDENALENKGVSVAYVPDMWFDAAGAPIASCFGQLTCAEPGATNNPGRGAQTYFYTNQQSARLLFYHDHAWGITRLNVYAGEAAPYLIVDDTETALTSPGGALEGLGIGIPLVIQDKTFVPSTTQLAVSDETWDAARWGGLGNLWLPHVYSPAQNPGDAGGVNMFGRWAYGPWFWPPTNNIAYGPIANAYFDPLCDPDVTWCEPPLMPGTPFNSMGMEAFHDTPVVNGVAYPTVTLDPGEYRFRILNAASDRFFNLSLYQADPAAPTEVQLNPAEVAAALTDGTIFPTPVGGTEGPSWVQIGTEGGFLPAPVVVPPQFITWVNDPTVFNAGNVDQHSLLLGPAERADVVVDLTPFAGQTLILYNDAPAAFPARDPRYDYYTGNGDYTDTGGAPSTLPGYGPNIRTVMQIVVNGTPTTPVPNHVNATRLGALQTAFMATAAGGQGVFENGQHPIIVGQGEYNSAYFSPAAPSTEKFKTNGPLNGTVQIFDTGLTFNTLPQPGSTALGTLSMVFQPKQIQDEMGEAFDRDYGRMSGFLGLESPNPQAGVQNMILYPFVNPASELIDATNLPKTNVEVTPIAVATDGSQIWKITHNGVDTHPIHFHLFDVQVLNRVGWDGIIRKPDANELGWKDTVRISPLEDTIVALRPVIPVTPFDAVLPNSTRPLNPAMPTNSSIMFTNMDAWGNPTVPIVNLWTNFGWEYVWHCHILSHEEMDMMRPISVSAPPTAPTLSAQQIILGNGDRANVLTWADNSVGETGFLIQRSATAVGPWADIGTVDANVITYSDNIGGAQDTLYYRVVALNQVGYSATAGYSTLTTKGISNVVEVIPPINYAPTTVSVTPNAGWSVPGAQVIFTAVYADQNGAGDIRYADFLINTSTAQNNAIYVRYDGSTGLMYLRHNNDGSWLGGGTPGVAGTIRTSYGILDYGASSVTPSGTTLTVNWAITPLSPMSGKQHNLYLRAQDLSGLVAGWNDHGDWIVNRQPTLIAPRNLINTTVSAGQRMTFDPRYSDLDGIANLRHEYLAIANVLPTGEMGAGAVYLWYDEAANKVWLANDAGTAWLGGFTPGTNNTISNSAVTVYVAQSTPGVANATTRIMRWRLQFKAAFAGPHREYMRAIDLFPAANGDTGWVDKGALTIAP